MSKKRPVGRPAAFEVGTRQVKLPEDLVQMMQWIIRLEGGTLAQLIDPLVRPTVMKRYTERYAEILAIKKAEDAAKKIPGSALPDPTEYINPVVPDFVPDEWTAEELANARIIHKFLGNYNPETGRHEFADRTDLSEDEVKLLNDALQASAKSYREAMKKFEDAVVVRGKMLAAKFPPVTETDPDRDFKRPLSKKPKK